MYLTVKDRLIIGAFYPKEGSLLVQTLVKDIKQKIQITKEEVKKIGLKPVTNKYHWDLKKAKVINADFTTAELNFLKEQVDRLDKSCKINQDILELCLKFRNYSPTNK